MLAACLLVWVGGLLEVLLLALGGTCNLEVDTSKTSDRDPLGTTVRPATILGTLANPACIAAVLRLVMVSCVAGGSGIAL